MFDLNGFVPNHNILGSSRFFQVLPCYFSIFPSLILNVFLTLALLNPAAPFPPQVYHASVVSMDQSGDDGGSGGGATAFSSPPPRLTFSRPFIFIVYQQASGSLLLMGRVTNPTEN